jgi:UDP-glucose 4-epimerase
MLASKKITDGTPVNAGIRDYISINDIAELIFEHIGWEPSEVNYQTEKPVGVKHRAADTSRIKQLTGWEPEWSLSEGLSRTMDWYTKSSDKETVEKNLGKLLHER